MIISHDLGTTGDKATLVSNDGEVLAAVTSSYGTDFGPRGKAEQNAVDWWDAVCTATRELLDRTSVPAEDIEVVSFSGQMMGAVLLDAAGAPVRPAIIWADTRSVAQTATLVDRVGMAAGYKITGHRLNPTYSLSKIMWVRDEEPEAFGRTTTVVLAKDFVVYRLTGVLATDPSATSCVADEPDRTTIGTRRRLRSALHSASTSRPLLRGRLRSSSTRLGRLRFACSPSPRR